jgi:hypothetical protein
MTTAVYRMPKTTGQISRPALLICHLRSTTPEEAIEKLQRAGVLAIPSIDESSIVLIAYRVEARRLLEYYRTGHLDAFDTHTSRFIGTLRKLALGA